MKQLMLTYALVFLHWNTLVFYTPPCSEILIHCGFPSLEFPLNLTADYVKSVAYVLSEGRTLTVQDYICFVAMSIN
ncbi:hypothetical protein VNO78_32111 [Psophocarpus tetragonolobus]|uniref:Uncharacterized protein n=1 Tax=Psophocarpus tetragonolobus TaxID=3891 RepID=A0AAN9RZ79_PSOTE